MAIQGIVALLVLIASSSVISANTTVPVSTLDDSTNAPNVSSMTVNPSTILSTSAEMDAPNSTTTQPTTQVTSINPESTTTEGTSIIPESTTTTEGTSIIPESSTTTEGTTTTTAPPHTRHFDGLSFLGGILLTVGAAGLLMGGYKYFGPGRGDKGAYNRIGMKDLYGESDHLQV